MLLQVLEPAAGAGGAERVVCAVTRDSSSEIGSSEAYILYRASKSYRKEREVSSGSNERL
jgi:hypothetical protein